MGKKMAEKQTWMKKRDRREIEMIGEMEGKDAEQKKMEGKER